MTDQEKVARLGLKREKGYLYFIDKDGDVSKVLMRQERQKQENNGESVKWNER